MDTLIAKQIAEEVQDKFGDFILKEINPGIVTRDKEGISYSKEVYRQACQLGMTLYPLSPELGGDGASKLAWGMMLEQVGYLCEDVTLPTVVSLQTNLIKTLLLAQRPDIFQEYVQPMLQGEMLGTFVYTDGADPFSFNTCARPVDGGYLVSGKKPYATIGDITDFFMVYVRDRSEDYDDLQVFLIKRDDPGVVIEPISLSGSRTAGVCTVYLNDVFLPSERLLVPTDGLSHVQFFLNTRRVILICPIIGRMQAILEQCISQTSKSIRYGKPLTAMQGVQAQIGTMYQYLETSRAIVYRALARESYGEADLMWDDISSLAKLYTVDSAIELALIAQRLLGGPGQLTENSFTRYLRDFCTYIPGGGTQESLKTDLGITAINKFELAV